MRIAALNALASSTRASTPSSWARLLVDAGTPLGVREHAAGLLAKANQPETRSQLLAALPDRAGPARSTPSPPDWPRAEEGGEKLLEPVAAGKASARLLQERAVAVRLETGQGCRA